MNTVSVSDLCSAALFGVPAVEAVTAASGALGRRSASDQWWSHAADRGRTTVAKSKVTMNSVGAGGASFSKMALTSTLPNPRGELVVGITSPAGDSTCHPLKW